jgi:hypothetical protein
MDGVAVMRELRRRGDVDPFAVVAMSSHVSAAASPARWFLRKPLDIDLTLAAVAEVCERPLSLRRPAETLEGRISTSAA